MAHIRIELDRFDGQGWQVRQEGDADVTAEQIAAMLPSYTVQYPHRAFIDGAMVASSERRRNGRVIVTRHDA
jgi:hypothetical protein